MCVASEADMQNRLIVSVLLLGAAGGAARAQSHFVRLGATDAGKVSRIAAAALREERMATAIRDETGNLKLIVWDVMADGTFTRRGSIGAGKTSEFALAALGTGQLVTGVRQEDGTLRLIRWTVDAAGNLAR